MQTMGICICERNGRIERKLALEGNGGLHDVRGAQCRADLVNRARRYGPCEGANRGTHREKVRIRDNVLLLDEAVESLGTKNIREPKAAVKHTQPNADHVLPPPPV